MAEDPPRVQVWCAGESWCPVTSTVALIGKKWHPVIIHRLLQHEGLGFNDLKSEVEGISSKVLSDALEDLEEKGLVNREIISEKPIRVEYSLTQLGRSLESVIEEMQNWGQTYLREANSEQDAIASATARGGNGPSEGRR